MSFRLHILGTSSALPSSNNISSAQILNIHEQYFLIDCAEATQIQMRKQKINFSRINHIFISHLHGDHFFGLFGLLSTYNLLGRNRSLHIYAPGNLEHKIYAVINKKELGYPIHFHTISGDKNILLHETKSLTITSFPLQHSIEAYGFLFKEKPKQPNIKHEAVSQYQLSIKDILAIKEGEPYVGEDGQVVDNKHLILPPFAPRSYAYCSDTAFNPAMIPTIQGVDLLYHEATFGADLAEIAKATGHSTTKDAGKIALAAEAKQLLIGHFSSRYKYFNNLLEETQAVFPRTRIAHPGDVFEIKRHRIPSA